MTEVPASYTPAVAARNFAEAMLDSVGDVESFIAVLPLVPGSVRYDVVMVDGELFDVQVTFKGTV